MPVGRSADDGHGWRADAIVVCIPVRDEAALLPDLLAALARQTVAPTRVCFLFDACTDASEAIVAAAAPRLPFAVTSARLPADGAAPSAGRARRAAMALGLAAARRIEPGRVALLSTDADSVPAAGWIAAAIAALGRADVAAGRIVRDGAGADTSQDRLERYLDRLFVLRRAIDPVSWESDDPHHFTGGANLAFRAAAYATLGGFAERGAGEDALIIDEAHRAGLRVRREGAMVVGTSSRRVGRALGGLACHLRALGAEAGASPLRVSHPADAAWQYRGHALARRYFADREATASARLAARIGVCEDHLLALLCDSPNAEAFAMRLVPGPIGGERLIVLAEAEAELDRLIPLSAAPAVAGLSVACIA